MGVAVIVFNGREHLDECFGTLGQQSRPADAVLAVDNASADGSLDLVRERFPAVRPLRLASNLGYAGGCNIAARSLDTDIVVFLNQDVRLDPDWLQELIRPLEADPTVTATQSLILLYEQPTLVNTSGTTVNFLGIAWVTDYRKPASQIGAQEVPFLSGAAFAIRRPVFLNLGGFDEGYGSYHEDVDLAWRMELCGMKTQLIPSSRVYHKYRFAGSARKNYLLERNRLLTLAKNYRVRTILLILPAFVASEIGICLLAIGQGWIGAKLASYRGFIVEWPAARRRRRVIQQTRTASDRRLTSLLSGSIEFEETNQPLVRIGAGLLNVYWKTIRRLISW